MGSLEENFGLYRELCTPADPGFVSMEPIGIGKIDDYKAATEDPTTVTIGVNGLSIPVLTQLHNVPNTINSDYFVPRLAPEGTPLYHFSPMLDYFVQNPTQYRAATGDGFRAIAAEEGVIIFDHADAATERLEQHLMRLGERIGFVPFDLIRGRYFRDSWGKARVRRRWDEAAHNLFLSKGWSLGYDEMQWEPVDNSSRHFLYSLWDEAVASQGSTLTAGPARLEQDLRGDLESLWDIFRRQFGKIEQDDPSGAASYTKEGLATILGSPQFVKSVYRSGGDPNGEIINVCLACGIEACGGWMHEPYFQRAFPAAYTCGRIIFGAGLVTDPSKGREAVAASMQTIGLIGRLVNQARVKVVFGAHTDARSTEQVPGLMQFALLRAGLTIGFCEPRQGGPVKPAPVDHHRFRAFQLLPG